MKISAPILGTPKTTPLQTPRRMVMRKARRLKKKRRSMKKLKKSMKTVIIKKLRMMSMWLAVVEEVVTEACM
jgi:hypothetical protein